MLHYHVKKPKVVKGKKVIVLVGSPNVGKSALFYRLTGKYAWVSNYPGTTVEITMGEMHIDGEDFLVVDTPGTYSLIPTTEDERVTLKVLLEMNPQIVIHVVEAKTLRETLPLTFMLLEAGMKVILAVNAIDEARKLGLSINFKLLRKRLGIPVVPTVAITGEGVETLKREIIRLINKNIVISLRIKHPEWIERKIRECENLFQQNYSISRRMLALLALLGEEEILRIISANESSNIKKVQEIMNFRRKVELLYALRLSYVSLANSILVNVLKESPRALSISEKLNELMIKPITGIPILILTLLMFYLFVGLLGAQVIVDYLESAFETYVNTATNNFLREYLPYPWLYELIGGEYGIVTLGLRYGFSIILPIVSFFFIAFSIIEDCGYLPRLAMLVDNLLKRIGLSGRAIIPLILGLGCDTMATITTRTLESEKEKLLATIVLALGVPCSAQLGVIMGLIPNFTILIIWTLIVLAVLLLVAYSASRLIPGEIPLFIMELPPLRIPRLENILLKTWARLEWYLKEVIPLFILASILIWVGRITGIFELIISILSIPTTWMGLPKEASVAFLYGFFRRDYGAAGFYDLRSNGLLNDRQILIAMVAITLFVPCIAQFIVTIRERGIKTALAILILTIFTAFLIGYLTNILVSSLGIL